MSYVSLKEKVGGQLKVRQDFGVMFASLLVGVYGIYIIADSLVSQLGAHRGTRLTDLSVDLPLLLGLSVIYLSVLLRRRKRTAWFVSILAYAFYFAIGVNQHLQHMPFRGFGWLGLVRYFIFPLIIIALLIYLHKEFVVKSDIQGFRFALKFIVIMLSVTIIYGVAGFELMDTSDFHQEIGWQSALHYTVDQFNLTTTKPVQPYTKRAHLFVDSLSFVSFIALLYAVFSLFQPLKARLYDQTHSRERIEHLLDKYGAPSEEFFKLWPHDKQYFFTADGEAALAFHVYRGVALVLSDPVGEPKNFKVLMEGFNNLCFSNDWLPSMVHVSDNLLPLYEGTGYTMQKLGQEAIVSLDHFEAELLTSKYFRQILNKFNKQGYTFELLKPPHHQAVLDRLKIISDDWLSKGNRAERGFVMGYYTHEYMQACEIGVARDAAHTIQAFVNIVPAGFDKVEATYDLLRQSSKSLSNVNDYLLIKLIEELKTRGYHKLNMGLSPLAGLDEIDEKQRSILDNVLKFAYANGDRFYSFSGLFKFKDKYEPKWQDKYIGYKGGLRGYSRTMTALTRCMSKVVRL